MHLYKLYGKEGERGGIQVIRLNLNELGPNTQWVGLLGFSTIWHPPVLIENN